MTVSKNLKKTSGPRPSCFDMCRPLLGTDQTIVLLEMEKSKDPKGGTGGFRGQRKSHPSFRNGLVYPFKGSTGA